MEECGSLPYASPCQLQEKALPATPDDHDTTTFMTRLRRRASALTCSLSPTKRAISRPPSTPSFSSTSPPPPPLPPPVPPLPIHVANLPAYHEGGPLVFSFPSREGGRPLTHARTDRKEKRNPSPYLLDRKPAPFVVRSRTSSYHARQTNSTHSSDLSSLSPLSRTSTASSYNLPSPISAHFPVTPSGSVLSLEYIPNMREYRCLRQVRDDPQRKSVPPEEVSECEDMDPYSALPAFLQDHKRDRNSTPIPATPTSDRRPLSTTSQRSTRQRKSRSQKPPELVIAIPSTNPSSERPVISSPKTLKRSVRRRPTTAPDSRRVKERSS
ncbi:hypothetical protein DL96DRAFT_1622079 [Flagelloscypha sp. PMI_526]|nr:hypothetical protein DL96DRAFT_1622079 [Flagelloscypha sp. PMI_526]